MPLSLKDVFQILALLEKSQWQDLHVETPDFKLTVSKEGHAPAIGRDAVGDGSASSQEREGSHPRAVSGAHRAPPAKPARTSTGETPPAQTRDDHADDPSFTKIRSPALGTFYVAPQPGAPPFVKVGQTVGPDDTVAIVEVMKLMNHVKSGTSGTVARVCAANGDLVEFNQVLFLLEPPGGDA